MVHIRDEVTRYGSEMLDLIDFAIGGIGLLILLLAVAFIIIIWSAALGSPIV